MTKGKRKPFWKMNAAELARATREFDHEFVLDTFGPPPPAAKAAWERAKRKGRARAGQDEEQIRISMERRLLQRADAFAKRNGLSRSQLIARGVEMLLTAANGKTRVPRA